MSNPEKPVISYSYTGFQASLGDGSFPGTQLDADMAELVTSIDQTIDALANIRRADGALANGIVTIESLAPTVQIGVRSPAVWAAVVSYAVSDMVLFSQKFYFCLVAHVSGVFATDLAAGNWAEVTLSITGYTADQIVYDNGVSGLVAEDVQAAIDELAGGSLSSNIGMGVVAVASGASVDFNGVIPAWARRVTCVFKGISTNGASLPLLRLGDAGGIEASGYLGNVGSITSSPGVAAETTGFGLNSAAASSVRYGKIVLDLMDADTFTWAASGVIADVTNSVSTTVAGIKSLSNILDRVRLTTVNGVDTFDGTGSMNISWE